MERQNGMSEIGDNWSWEEDFQKDLDEGAAEVESFANSKLVVHGPVLAGHIEKIYNSSFGMAEYLRENPDEMADWNNEDLDHVEIIKEGFLNASIPTTFLFGQFSDGGNFGKLVVTNFPTGDEEDDLHASIKKVGKHLARLSQLVDKNKIDFCIVSYPVVFDADQDWGEGYDAHKLHLLSIIFTPEGSVGRAFSSRRELTQDEVDCEHDHKPVQIQYELPSGKDKMIITYRELLKMWKRLKSDNEAMYYTKMVQGFFNTPSFYTKSAMKDDLNHLIDGMGKNKSLFVGSKNIFHEEIHDEVTSVPSDGFVILEDDVKEFFLDQIKVMLEDGEIQEADFDNMTRILKGYQEEE